jgi:hypothetical protein
MKKILIISTLFLLVLVSFSCKKDTKSPKLILLTSHVWVADSLLANGAEVGGVGGLLEAFNGDTKFNEDGTGYVGTIVGTWQFSDNEQNIIIISQSLPIPVTTKIIELTDNSLKLTTSYPLPVVPPAFLDVRMTFKPK